MTGSAFAINAVVATDQLDWLGAAWSSDDVVRDPDGARSWRCAECGTLLFADHPMFGDTKRFVRVGTLDAGESLVPDAHYFVRSKHPWVVVPDGIPAYDTLPNRTAGRPPTVGADDRDGA